MDEIDWQILAELQEDGRLSITDLAARVGLSVSPCHRRVRALEETGVIRGYRAVPDPAAAGFGFEAVVFVYMARTDKDTVVDLESRLGAIPEIIEAERLFGEPDFLLRIVTASLETYQALYDEVLTALPGVEKVRSTIVMRHVVAERGLPARPCQAP